MKDNPDYQTFNLKIIRDLLEDKGMTQTDLADMIGRDNTSISRIIRSGRTTTRMLEKITMALEVSLHTFIEGNPFGELDEAWYQFHQKELQ